MYNYSALPYLQKIGPHLENCVQTCLKKDIKD